MANFPSAGITLADDASLEQVIKALRFIATQTARNTANSVRQVQADPRMKDQRVAYALRSLAHDIEIVDMGRGVQGDVLGLVNARQAAFMSVGNPGPGGTVPSGAVSDGDKGDITVSAGGTVWTIDNGAVTAAKIADRTRRMWIPMQAGWVQANGIAMSASVLGTYPDVYQGWGFVDAPAVGPQAMLYQWKVPKDWASGTVEAKMLYRVIQVGVSAGTTFDFRLKTLAYAPGASPVSAATSVTTVVAHPGEYVNTHEQSLGTITVAADNMVRIVIERNTGGTDDSTDTVNVIGVALEYTADS